VNLPKKSKEAEVDSHSSRLQEVRTLMVCPRWLPKQSPSCC